jgi:hypothetical protein
MRGGRLGTSGHGTAKSSILTGACFLHQAPARRRDHGWPRETCLLSHRGLRDAQAALSDMQESSEDPKGVLEGVDVIDRSWSTLEDVRLSAGSLARKIPQYPCIRANLPDKEWLGR